MKDVVDIGWQDMVDITGHVQQALEIARRNCRDPTLRPLYVVVDVLIRVNNMTKPIAEEEEAPIAPPQLPQLDRPRPSVAEQIKHLAKTIWSLFCSKKADKNQETDNLSKRDGQPRDPLAPPTVIDADEQTLPTRKTRRQFPCIGEQLLHSAKVNKMQETGDLFERASGKVPSSSLFDIVPDGSYRAFNTRGVSYPSPPSTTHCQGRFPRTLLAASDGNKPISPSACKQQITIRTVTTTEFDVDEDEKEVLVSQPKGQRIRIVDEVFSPEVIQPQGQPADNQRQNNEENPPQAHPAAQSRSITRQTGSPVNLDDESEGRAASLIQTSNN
jgi:hypothetical protein